jgi:hypothetical protein
MEREKNIKLAIKWFEERSVETHLVGGTDLYVRINMMEILVADAEINYRADLQKGK